MRKNLKLWIRRSKSKVAWSHRNRDFRRWSIWSGQEIYWSPDASWWLWPSVSESAGRDRYHISLKLWGVPKADRLDGFWFGRLRRWKRKGKTGRDSGCRLSECLRNRSYPSIEEKAANLLYFLIKDHPFADGCKRIGASIFLEFLNKNKALYKEGKQVISNSALVAITLMVAESRPEEKDIMVTLIMNFLK